MEMKNKEMSQKNNIDRLDKKLREEIIKLLNDPTVRLVDIVNIINEKAGENIISQTGVWRYKKRLDRMLEKKKQIEAIALSWNEKTSDKIGNILGKQTMEEIRVLLYDFIGKLQTMQDGEVSDMSIKEISQMAVSIEKATKGIINLESAIASNSKHSQQIREATLNEVREKAIERAKSSGISQKTVDTILADVFNINE